MPRKPSIPKKLSAAVDAGAERQRLVDDNARKANWKRWGPYLSERQWATVREDYSAYGTCWDYFPHDHARSRAYRWGEDGILGFTDRECRLCFGLSFWNGKDPILKERLFGLTGPQGNHGEDVKETYFFLDSTPTHSYCKALYKYPQAAFPYQWLIDENARRGLNEPEFELEDTGLFDQNRYFDIYAEYAKNSPNDILIRITVANRGPDKARLCLLPTLWFRNTWSWGDIHEGSAKPVIKKGKGNLIDAIHPSLEKFSLAYDAAPDGSAPLLLFTENESNTERLWNTPPSETPYYKDGFHEFVIRGDKKKINWDQRGTKAAPLYDLQIEPGATQVIQLRLSAQSETPTKPIGPDFNSIFDLRKKEADAFYDSVIPPKSPPETKNVIRQGYAGLLWSKQFYHYIVKDWLNGDPAMPPPPPERLNGRNAKWTNLYCRDVLSMPDTWEYPWFAAWDLSFHMLPYVQVDPDNAKQQLSLLLREWYMYGNGQLPAYEFAFSDVNPPVHAWSAWRVYKISGKDEKRDRMFLESVFQKLLLNFTWWTNRKDPEGNNLFGGGFLGLDNIGVFDRNSPLPGGGFLQQADGTAWMAFYCLTMLGISIELAMDNHVYEDLASKFFEHFIAISDAINSFGGHGLWDEDDGFYYDQIKINGMSTLLKTRSVVGLIPLLAVELLDGEKLARLPGFTKRMNWFLNNRPDLKGVISAGETCPTHSHDYRILAIPSQDRLEKALRYLLDENEFFSPHGIRSVSRFHRDHPFIFKFDGQEARVDYVPGESNTRQFGGNSNWRGPVWFPINYLLVEALERYDQFYGDRIKVECPTGSGNYLSLKGVATELSRRLGSIFLPDQNGMRPCHGGQQRYASDPNWKNLVLFHEYFNGDNGKGLGANHQTGWTSLAIRCLESCNK